MHLPFMGNVKPFRAGRSGRRRGRRPGAWQPYRRRRSPFAAEIRVQVWIGMILGLLAFQALRWWTEPSLIVAPPPVAVQPAPDPWAEARRSRAILEAQEGAPVPAAPVARRLIVASPASVRVIDGDTFVYGGQTIRIADIDTPETHPPRCAREGDLGARATRRLHALLNAGPFELVPIDRDVDRYGRRLRIVVRDGRPIGDTLIAEGLARPYGHGRRSWCNHADY